jgi:hypothetical protein
MSIDATRRFDFKAPPTRGFEHNRDISTIEGMALSFRFDHSTLIGKAFSNDGYA